MHEQIRRVVRDSGLWDNGRESSHGFILSPDVYKLPSNKRNELETIGAALHDCLAGLGRIAAIALNPKLNHSATWGMIARILRTGVPTVYHDIMSLYPSGTPSVCKVDIMESESGEFRIAEIDGHNKHGLGYSTLAARIRRALMPDAKHFPGVAATLACEVERRGENSVALIYADQERFYLPEFRILQDELAAHRVEVVVIAESDARVKDGRVVASKDGKRHRLFIDFPFMSISANSRTVNQALAASYRAGEIDFLIPPKPFYGSKAVLALVRNDSENEELEAILKSQIRSASLEIMRQYIPETHLVHKRASAEHWRSKMNGNRFVLKESISSGMKGTVFSDEPHFHAVMRSACASHYRFVLQKEVTNHSRNFQYFTEGGCLQQSEWFMRITVHYLVRGVADIIITARRDKKVHGAPDCLQLGAIIV